MMRRPAIVLLLLSAALFTACSNTPAGEDLQDRISELESENADLHEQLDAAQSEASTAAAAAAAIQSSRLAAQAQARDERLLDERDDASDAAYGNDDAGRAADRAAEAAGEAAAAASDD